MCAHSWARAASRCAADSVRTSTSGRMIAGRQAPTATGCRIKALTSSSGTARPGPTTRARAATRPAGAGPARRRTIAARHDPRTSHASMVAAPVANAQAAGSHPSRFARGRGADPGEITPCRAGPAASCAGLASVVARAPPTAGSRRTTGGIISAPPGPRTVVGAVAGLVRPSGAARRALGHVGSATRTRSTASPPKLARATARRRAGWRSRMDATPAPASKHVARV